uniref:Apple domain-containing protein n=1 Tax=Minutocellus polymorphus TaxID=265543 RepID=A0A7S0AQA3_9STRA|mmetsp:Transcript_1997/g.3355  ORF Transcript_1997/g.3355 Transcript_1997/m.3355 type:complete len:335 (+) Transcript_1997:231-1235(+)
MSTTTCSSMHHFRQFAIATFLCSFSAVVVVVNAQSNLACPYGNPIYGASIIYGRNEGGCYLCDDDNGAPLSGDDLVKSCQRMCEEDDKCKSFEVGNPALAPFYEELNNAATNCCLEYDVIADDHPLYLDSRDVDFETADCAKQATCWNSFVRSEYLQDENVNCDQNAPVIPAATEGTGQLKGTAAGSGGLALPVCRQVTWPDESLVGAKLFQMIAKRKKWFAEGCPLIDADDTNADKLEYLLNDAYSACLESIEMEETQNRLDNPDDAYSGDEPTTSLTDKPSFRPTLAPTPRSTDDIETRDGDSDTSSSATSHSHYAQLSFSILAVATYVIFS